MGGSDVGRESQNRKPDPNQAHQPAAGAESESSARECKFALPVDRDLDQLEPLYCAGFSQRRNEYDQANRNWIKRAECRLLNGQVTLLLSLVVVCYSGHSRHQASLNQLMRF